MTVRLPASQEEFIQRKIADGAFSTPDAVISEAVKLLQEQERWKVEAASKIAQGWNEAKSGMLISEEALVQQLNERKAEWNARASKR